MWENARPATACRGKEAERPTDVTGQLSMATPGLARPESTEEHRPRTRTRQDGQQRSGESPPRWGGGTVPPCASTSTASDGPALPRSPPRAHRRHGRVEGGQPRGGCRNPRSAAIARARRRPGGDLCSSAARARHRGVRTWHRWPRPRCRPAKEGSHPARGTVRRGSSRLGVDRRR